MSGARVTTGTMRVLARIEKPVEAETPYGGRVVSYEPLGSVWLKMETRRRRERTDGGAVSAVDIASAEARADPRLTEGRVVRFGGGDWSIAAVDGDPDRPGRVALTIERTR